MSDANRLSTVVPATFCLFLLAVLLPPKSPAQSATDAVQLLALAQNAFEGKLTVSSVTLTGNADFVSGSTTQNGIVTLTARSDGSSSFEFNAGSASRTETQGTFANGQTCSWSGADGVIHQSAGHNCMIPVAWFLPEPGLFSLQQPSDATYSVVTATGNQTGLRWRLTPPSTMPVETSTLLSHIGTFDLLIDSASSLPAQLSYSLHPDTNAGIDMPVRVVYSDYRPTDGVAIPFHIQRYFNGMLTLDITLTDAVVTH